MSEGVGGGEPIMIRDYGSLLAELTRRREELKWTKRALSAKLGMSSAVTGPRETGRRIIAADDLIETLDLFGYDLALIPREDSQARGSGCDD